MSTLRRAAGVATFAGAWLIGFTPSGGSPCAGVTTPSLDPIEAACADAEHASACGGRCDAISSTCSKECVKKQEPCFKACPTHKADEAKKMRSFDDDKCLAKCAEKLQPCVRLCHATRAKCREKCPSP